MNIESGGFKRSSSANLLESLQKNHSFLLLGARQTGKSTLLEGLFTQLPQDRVRKYYFQLPSQTTTIAGDPELILREVQAMSAKEPVYVLIDEIQKIPAVMSVLQYLIDHRLAIVAASGSSARKMKTLGTNWLPGRIHLHHLYPLTWQETGYAPEQLQTILRFGGLPGVLSESDDAAREQNLESYFHLYLEEEIRIEALVRNVPRFAKFLRLAALESGTAPNLSKIGSQVEMSHTSIREYFQILEDSLIIHRLNAFGTQRDAVLRTPKYYFFDIGVRNAASGIGHSKGVLVLQSGVLFEHFIILELIAHFGGTESLSYWRTKQGEEVDIIIDHRGHRMAVEIKTSTKPNADDLKGLHSFCNKYKFKEAYLVCQIARAQKFGDITALPWWEFLQLISRSTF